MSAARVVVIDDSVVVRAVISRELATRSDLVLVGDAGDGRAGMELIRATDPDVVILDLEMPVMDGLATLSAIRGAGLSLPVVVFSQVPRAAAGALLDALSLSAVEFVEKPGAGSGIGAQYVRAELLPVVAALAQPRPGGRPGRPGAAPPAVTPADPGVGARSGGPVTAVVVASSTGGPEALGTLFSAFTVPPPVPMLVVQHMPAEFTGLLAQRLDRLGAAPVREAVDGQRVVPGTALIAPGGRHLGLERRGDAVHVCLQDGPKENFCRPAADVLFRAAAAVYRAGVLGVVLTGMGRDGLAGSRAILAAGGAVLAQSAATCVVPSMPAAVAGLGAEVVDLPAMADRMAARWRRGR